MLEDLKMVPDETIHGLSREAAERSPDRHKRKAARITAGVPVYSDMMGELVVFGDGRVLYFDTETNTVRPVEEDLWRRIALAQAAQKFPEQKSLLPSKHPGTITCLECGGTGVVCRGIICGSCQSLGWVDAPTQ
jgi:hypothetical protein